jgi:hypothetical protein
MTGQQWLLTDEGSIQVALPEKDPDQEDPAKGGEPNIDVSWVGQESWDGFTPPWNSETVGVCNISREDPNDKSAITKVEWVLNRAFAPYEKVLQTKKLAEAARKTFEENYQLPVLMGLFKQRLAEETKELEADESGNKINIPDDYVVGERARLARAVLMAMEPEMMLADQVDK